MSATTTTYDWTTVFQQFTPILVMVIMMFLVISIIKALK